MKLKMFDCVTDYTVDKVNCFVKPNANILNYLHNNFGSLFLIFQMLNDLYDISSCYTIDPELIYDIYRIKIKTYTQYKEVTTQIKASINKNNPILVGVDLFELFYSKENYKVVHWPHWFIVTGYDENKKIVYILDNSHIDITDPYKEFQITYDILEKTHNSFNKYFPDKKSLVVYSSDVINKNDLDVLMDILLLYLKKARLNEDDFYKISGLFNCASSICDNIYENIHDNIMINEIINNNKRREVLRNELTKFLSKIGYGSENIEQLSSVIRLCSDNWSNYIMRNFINLQKKTTLNDINANLIFLEKKFYNEIKKCYMFLLNLSSNSNYSVSRKDILECTKNNDDNIMSIRNKKLEFIFNNGKVYNWWIEDDSPKYILYSGKKKKSMITVKTKYDIMPEYKECNFQVGIYLINKAGKSYGEKSFFCGIDNNNMFILDCIDSMNNNCPRQLELKGELYIKFSNNILTAGVIEDNKYVKELECYCELGNEIEIGLSCKTWGNGCYLQVLLSDYFVEFE